ncbi:MAG TPA: hypothetical protein VJ783_25860 [Pirellulales bacterium]|nr:hypothetical protein [Pirellulales bacterium]
MPDVVLLDAGPLGIASHPRPSPEILAWISQLLAAGVELLVPEFWADARKRGRPTASDAALDAT